MKLSSFFIGLGIVIILISVLFIIGGSFASLVGGVLLVFGVAILILALIGRVNEGKNSQKMKGWVGGLLVGIVAGVIIFFVLRFVPNSLNNVGSKSYLYVFIPGAIGALIGWIYDKNQR